MSASKPRRIGLFGRHLLISALCFALLGVIVFVIDCQASEISQVVPVEEWTGKPEWSPDGRFVAVHGPTPALVGADGKLSRVIGEPTKRPRPLGAADSSAISSKAKRSIRTRTSRVHKHTLILKSPSYELLPVAFPLLWDLCWSPDCKMIAGREFNVGCQIFDIYTGKVLLTIGPEGEFAWSPDSKLIAQSQRNGVDVWDVMKKEKVFSLPKLRAGMHCSLAWSADGTKIAAAVARSNGPRQQKTLLRICSADGQELLSLYDKLGINNIGWSQDKKLFAYSDNALHILDGDSFKEVKVLAPKDAEQVDFAWAPNGKCLAYRAEDATLHVFDVDKMQEVSTVQAEKTGRFHFEWSPDSKFLLVQGLGSLAVCRASDGSYLGARMIDGVSKWTPDGKALMIRKFSPESVGLLPVDLQSGKIAFDKGIVGNPWREQKVLGNLDDCFEELSKSLSVDDIAELKNTPEDRPSIDKGGYRLRMSLPNTLGLRSRNPLTMYFRKMGISDSENMSTFIIESFWRHLNGKPLYLDELVSTCRRVEEQEKYIIVENRALPDNLLNCEFSPETRKRVTIGQLPGGTKVVTFIAADIGYLSLRQMRAIESVRLRYPEKQVSFAIIMFPNRALGESRGSWWGRSDCMRQKVELEKRYGSSICMGVGNSTMYNSLKEFTHGVWSANSHRGLPQTLIINEKNLVTARINGLVREDDTFPIEDAIDELLKAGKNFFKL